MTADRRPSTRGNPQTLPPSKRRVRYSQRYHTYQIIDKVTGQWRNINPEMYHCYVAAGIKVEENQMQLF